MNIKKAKEVLSKNVLDLSMAGMDYIPVKTIRIEEFEIMNTSKSNPKEEPSWNEKAYLIGIFEEVKKQDSFIDQKFICRSYMIQVHHTYYYRDFFHEAMEVIQALRTVNQYNDPFPEESVTITL